jgi:hypothetical protein
MSSYGIEEIFGAQFYCHSHSLYADRHTHCNASYYTSGYTHAPISTPITTPKPTLAGMPAITPVSTPTESMTSFILTHILPISSLSHRNLSRHTSSPHFTFHSILFHLTQPIFHHFATCTLPLQLISLYHLYYTMLSHLISLPHPISSSTQCLII